MVRKRFAFVAALVALLVLLWATGGVVAGPPAEGPGGEVNIAGTVASKISYQGRLTDPAGNPLDGTYTMQFQLYDAQSGGTMLWDSGAQSVQVTNGLFNVELDVDPANFNGQELWLAVKVGTEWLSPRQQILPVPYALSLRPGAWIKDEDVGHATLSVQNGSPGGFWMITKKAVEAWTSDGTALWGAAGSGTAVAGISDSGDGVRGISSSGHGVYGESTDYIGVYGSSTNHWSGWFDNGIRISDSGWHGLQIDNSAWAGIWVDNSGYDGFEVSNAGRHGLHVHNAAEHGVYVEGAGGHSVYATGTGVAEAGATILAENTGGGAALWGKGSWAVVGDSTGAPNYAGYFYDDVYVGGKIDLAGTIDPIVGERFKVDPNGKYEVGDLLVIDPDSPYLKLSTEANDTKVIGVVGPSVDFKDGELMVIVLGYHGAKPQAGLDPSAELPERTVAKIKVDASYGAIKRGDLLTSSPTPGHAMKAQPVNIGGVEIYRPGTIIGKALESLDSGRGLIEVFIALQ